ncbi:hypothetical protein [Pontibacillus marinus]|uniref:Uncharacterized protein n=1 Tax=Pontibacillus marinus BH030004 = DSM 16465 TaxID=1385511 RepID=A0A0A5I7U2_9BACI|nr:hypothetical protein [Pontibacillus marinus]KGX91907.1 hypothetical protein N783_00945 [Pontibacillus marinus BH030004 = DSM 16465]
MKRKLYWIGAIVIVACLLFVYFDLRIQIKEKQAVIDAVEDDIYNYALHPEALSNALQRAIKQPTKENFAQLLPIWESTEHNLQALFQIHKNEIDEKVYEEYYKYRHNQVNAMFYTYADPELKPFEDDRKDDLKRILKAWEKFSGYLDVFGGYREIENPNQFAEEYTKFLKGVQINWP